MFILLNQSSYGNIDLSYLSFTQGIIEGLSHIAWSLNPNSHQCPNILIYTHKGPQIPTFCGGNLLNSD